MSPDFLSTGQAAKLCSVTPDTILKWIRSGRLAARRTPGGHHRIERSEVERILQAAAARPRPSRPQVVEPQLRFCWEYKGKGELLEGCRDCVVYELRAQRCYEVVKLQPELGHNKLFCEASCEQCDYYQHVQGQRTNVLVVTDDQQLVATLQDQGADAGFNLEFTDCEYRCSALVDVFRPDFAVVDCSLGPQVSSGITAHLSDDPRIPFVRVILAGSDRAFPEDCEQMVFGRIDKPFGIQDLAACALSGGPAGERKGLSGQR